jgi:2,4-dienoyl-CoA reductase-like NADH-dependent reductase (Old Yellow Enzyme family)
VLRNRIAKAAMTEGIADAWGRPTARHITLYRRWAQGGAGLLLTGNVMIDRRVLERPGNVAIDPVPAAGADAALIERFRTWARAGTDSGTHLWMQISHAGRQSPWYVTREPLAPSAVQLKLLGNYRRPRALEEVEIAEFIGRFARVAAFAKRVGFTGVQVHAAHGYLISSFLSGVTNQRNDRWGGSLENRARFLLEVLRAVRAAVGAEFPVSVKLNSADFQRGGFSPEECLQVVHWLNALRIDLLEISGGTYEQPRLMGYRGRATSAVEASTQSTHEREAYFLEYAERIREVVSMPLMVTGGFRSRMAMESALTEGHTDVVGLGRPLCVDPRAPLALLNEPQRVLPRYEALLRLGPGPFAPGTRVFLLRIINVLGQQGWFYRQIFRLADGEAPQLRLGVLRAMLLYLFDEYRSAWRRRRVS